MVYKSMMIMNESYKRICNDLSKIGIKAGDALLVHSSFKSLGVVEGGIETFISALKDTVGEKGTLKYKLGRVIDFH